MIAFIFIGTILEQSIAVLSRVNVLVRGKMDGVTNVTGTQPIARRTFSPSEIAAATSLSLQTIRKMIRLGELKAVRVRRRLLIPADELDRLCELK